MPTYTLSANELKYTSSSSWTSGKARQGVYSSTRYQGAIKFSGLSNLNYGNIAISQIQMVLTFDQAGASSTKNLTMYECPKSSISGTMASMRGSPIGAVSVPNAYSATQTVTFNASSNSSLFNKLVNYFASGGTILTLYVSSTRGTYSGGYCYDYLAVTAAKMTFTYEYLQSNGSLASTSIAAGSAATLNITAYNSAYTHRVKWTFGAYSTTQTVAAGAAYASYTIPLDWLNAIPSALNGAGSVLIETIDTSGASLGSYTYSFTVTVPATVVPAFSSVTASPSNDNSVIAGWGLYVQGKTKANLSIAGAAGAYGSVITSYSITTSPSIGSATSASVQTATITQTGTITVTGKITDSRGRTATKTTTFAVQAYAAPSFTAVDMYRCTNTGTRNDTDGTYAYLKASFTCSTVSEKNGVSGRVAIQQVGGSYNTSANITSGTDIVLGGGSLAIDATFKVTFTLTDTVGSVSTFIGEISSAAYIIHVKKGGKAVGFGMAAGADNTVSFGWPVQLSAPLGVAQGGTGANNGASACANIGAVKKSGDTMTDNLNIQASLYPSLYLLPTYNGTTNRTVFEGSYSGASSFAAWQDSSGTNRRMLEVRNAAYEASRDNAVVLRDIINGAYYSFRVFHAGMASPVPVGNGGTGANNAKAALSNLGIFYSATLPSSGTDGQICLVPV